MQHPFHATEWAIDVYGWVPRMPTRFRADRTDSITEVRDLHTGVPMWASGGHSPFGGAPLLSPAKADVVIVGSGITGALIALAASQKGLSTVVIDRRPPAQGSTAASTALLQFEIDTPLIRLADRVGMERASRAWLRCFHAVDDLAYLVRRLRIPCDFRQRRALYLGRRDIERGGDGRGGAPTPAYRPPLHLPERGQAAKPR